MSFPLSSQLKLSSKQIPTSENENRIIKKKKKKYLRAFTLEFTKIPVYFSIRTYFFIIIHIHFSKHMHMHQIIYFKLHFIKILIFLIVSFSSHNKERINNKMQNE